MKHDKDQPFEHSLEDSVKQVRKRISFLLILSSRSITDTNDRPLTKSKYALKRNKKFPIKILFSLS